MLVCYLRAPRRLKQDSPAAQRKPSLSSPTVQCREVSAHTLHASPTWELRFYISRIVMFKPNVSLASSLAWTEANGRFRE